MAVDKLVDSTQLDADLTSVANAIRTKGGTSAQMAFPAGFVSAVQAIPTGITPSGTKSITENGTYDVTQYASAEVNVSGGGGITVDDVAKGTISGVVVLDSTTTEIREYAFFKCPITSIKGIGVTKLGRQFLEGTSIVNLDDPFPNMTPSSSTITGDYVFGNITSLKRAYFTNTGTFCAKLDTFRGCSNLVVLRMPNQNGAPDQRGAYGCTKLKVVDWGMAGVWKNMFNGCTLFDTLILRNSSIQSLGDVNAFSNTPFRGYNSLSGTVYIPKSLYDHLGDGSSLDYQSATNWSSLYSGGYCTFAKLEGSPYEATDWDDSSLWQ